MCTKVHCSVLSWSSQDNELIEKAREVVEGRSKQVVIDMEVNNRDRTFGATLSNYISK